MREGFRSLKKVGEGGGGGSGGLEGEEVVDTNDSDTHGRYKRPCTYGKHGEELSGSRY